MQIDLIRELGTEGYTIGTMRINNAYECYTLEDQVRPEKIYGETAIPEGTYKVIVSYSPRFKRDLPLLLNVPNFEGIRIHTGNYAGLETFFARVKIDNTKALLATEEYVEVV